MVLLRVERDLLERFESRILPGDELGEDDFLLNALDRGAISKASLSHLLFGIAADIRLSTTLPEDVENVGFLRSRLEVDDEYVELFDSLRCLRSRSLSRLELLLERCEERLLLLLLVEADDRVGDLRLLL